MELKDIFALLSGIGVLMAGLGFGYSQFKSGSGKAKDDLVETLEKQLQIEKETTKQLEMEKTTLINSHQEQLNTMRQELGKLQGLHQANEQKIKEYTELLQGRSPDQEAFMKLLTQSATDGADYMKKTSVILDRISRNLDRREARSKGGEKK